MSFQQLDDKRKAELWAVLALRKLPGLGANRRKKLAEHFGSPYLAIKNVKSWNSIGLGIPAAAAKSFMSNNWREEAKIEWDKIRDCPANILLYNDHEYPQVLREISDSPLLLFYFGEISLLKNPAVAVVGARDCTAEGIATAEEIVRNLSASGVTVVSGMARGIDRVVHIAALEGVGRTIAVLGSGIDVAYPRSNQDLYSILQKQGVVISEFIPGTAPLAMNFPIRNRIISGLSRAILVIEASMHSGTLITAKHALEQNRDVFAVPGGRLSETSEGCRELLRKGAKIAFSGDDILRDLAPVLKIELKNNQSPILGHINQPDKQDVNLLFSRTSKIGSEPHGSKLSEVFQSATDAEHVRAHETPAFSAAVELSSSESLIVDFLQNLENAHIENIQDSLDLDMSEVSSALIMLEIKGLIKRMPGMFYKLGCLGNSFSGI